VQMGRALQSSEVTGLKAILGEKGFSDLSK
jgi:hypothetical protein